jgi:hypothetical protein
MIGVEIYYRKNRPKRRSTDATRLLISAVLDANQTYTIYLFFSYVLQIGSDLDP